jgi:ribosome-associated protein
MPAGSKKIRPEITEAVERAAELALERKAVDVVALDLASISGATDYFLLASGRSDVQVKAIAENIVERLKDKEIRPEHIEGLQGSRWVLIDYIDFVVHVFHEEARQFYQLELLWGDAPRLEFED